MRVFGIDPGSGRTGYGCVDSDGTRHRLVTCGAITAAPGASFPEKLHAIHRTLAALITTHRPDCVVIENLFHAKNARSALLLGHARGVAVLAAVEAGLPVHEYTPAAVKLAITGYGRAEKVQMQHMVKLLLGLAEAPQPHDAADALAIAMCHLHATQAPAARALRAASPRSQPAPPSRLPKRWRDYQPGPRTRRSAS